MAKIVYLFGAGASANALPVVNQMPDRVRKMIEDLPELEAEESASHPCSEEAMNELREQLHWLHDIIGTHATMDTLAKKLWIQNNIDDYNRLRFAISAYFILEQAYGKADTRYETFFVSLYNDSNRSLSDQVSVLSWNYDSQFEIAYRILEMQHSSSISDIHAVLGIDTNRVDREKFKILKLNRTALLSMDRKAINPFWGRQGMSAANYVHTLYVDGYKHKPENIYCPLTFAWDDFNKEDGLSAHIESRVRDAEILVVIGYSFPFFNRSVDRKIIDSMPGLKKIYFQDLNPGSIANAFRAISNKKFEIEEITYTAQFFLPPEL